MHVESCRSGLELGGAPNTPLKVRAAAADCKLGDAQMASPVLVGEKLKLNMHLGPGSKKVLHGLGTLLVNWTEAAAAVPGTPDEMVAAFISSGATISVVHYLKRLHKYFCCSDECLVIALVYIDRINKAVPSMTVCNLTIHRLLVTAIMLATKYHDEIYTFNRYYAKVGGVSLRELNMLEVSMLKLLNWELWVPIQDYHFYHGLICQAA
jgi:hypothetical protein